MLAGGEIARLWATVGADVTEFLDKMNRVEQQTQSTGDMIARALQGAVSVYTLRQVAVVAVLAYAASLGRN